MRIYNLGSSIPGLYKAYTSNLYNPNNIVDSFKVLIAAGAVEGSSIDHGCNASHKMAACTAAAAAVESLVVIESADLIGYVRGWPSRTGWLYNIVT